MTLLEVLNQKFAGELKKESEKQVQFVYSKFSPVESCIKKEKVALRDMLSLVQTNLLKFYIDLNEKDRIYQFFSTNQQRQILIDARELQEYINRSQKPDDPINLTIMALVNENIDNYQEALSMWFKLRGKVQNMTEGCERTVAIIKKKKDLQMIKEYAKWVLEENPKIGLTLFTTDTKTGEPPVDMNPDEVVDYLSSLDKHKDELTTKGGAASHNFPYLEFYYEYLISQGNSPDSYYTHLGILYVEKLFILQPPSFQKPSKKFSHQFTTTYEN
jgi:hypothetical protein